MGASVEVPALILTGRTARVKCEQVTEIHRLVHNRRLYALAYLAGHSDFGTTRRYVHLQAQTIRATMARAAKHRVGTKMGTVAWGDPLG